MQRQSLGGSPASSKVPTKQEENNATSPTTIFSDENKEKSQKIPKSSIKPENYLHLIPLLMVLCFLLLYLSSHHVSQKELAEFSGFKWPLANEDTKAIDGLEVERFIDVERSDLVRIRSLKNVQHEKVTSDSKYRLHRKIADF